MPARPRRFAGPEGPSGIVSASGQKMEEHAASDLIQRAAVLGDRARRTSIVARAVTRLAVPVTALACSMTVLAVVIRGPRWLGPSFLAVASTLAGLAFLQARVRRAVVDRVAAELDRAAGLDGALRSAWWFLATAPSRPAHDPRWLAFHISDAAKRVDGLDWRAVYASPFDRRRWLAACALVMAMFVSLRWPAPGARVPIRPADAVQTTSPSQPERSAVLTVNLPALTQGIREMKAGRVPSTESLAAVGRALDLAKSDPAAKNQLDALFKDTKTDRPIGDWSGPSQDDAADDDERTQALVNPWALEWAYQDALSRASAARPSRRDGEPAASSHDSVPQSPREDAREGTPGKGGIDKGGVDGAAVLGQARGQTAGFSSLLFGRQQADGDGAQKPAAGASAPSRPAALTMALRQEIVRASSDITDASPTGVRRAADNESSSGAGRQTSSTVTYERGRGSQPPAIPEDRRALVHELFVRPADKAPRPE
ncbi:MAG: hypothetical protein ABI634_15015 [Acidobacteriota bacterium]